MIRWSNTDGRMGQFESLLVGLDADSREQAITLWTQNQAQRIARSQRRRASRHEQSFKALCWGIVSAALLLAAASLGCILDMEKTRTVGTTFYGVRVIEDGASELRQEGSAR